MTVIRRQPTIGSVQGQLKQRLNALERVNAGTLTFYDSGTYSVVNGAVVWSGGINLITGGIIEFWASVVIAHSAVSTTTLTVDIDGSGAYTWASKATSGTLRVGTNPGSTSGTSGSSQPPAFIVVGWNLSPGPHTVNVTTTRPVTGGTSQLTDQSYAIRQA